MVSQWGVAEPFPIYLVKSRYFLYDANAICLRNAWARTLVVSHVRETHRMCGCLTGTLPQIPQQNVFLGLPLELMTEEAALLVEKGAGYVVDDVKAHEQGLKSIIEADKQAFLARRETESLREMQILLKAAEQRKKAFRTPKASSLKDGEGEDEEAGGTEEAVEGKEEVEEEPSPTTVFGSDTKPKNNHSIQDPSSNALRYYPVPSTSIPLYHSLPKSSSDSSSLTPAPSKTSYPLYKHLHSNSYFLSPGLRFGCQFMAYPGDPLRFHSHFVVTGMGWDEEIEMRDIVGGGRLGTGVKKAWMVGGEDDDNPGVVRTFCVEWGGF